MDCQLGCITDLLERFESGQLIAVIAITFGCCVAAVSIVTSMISRIVVSRHREQSRRELAAYVAAGSMDADKALAMLNAGEAKAKNSCLG